MTTSAQQPAPGTVEVLPPQRCWELLAAERFGRLVLTAAGSTDVWPVDLAVEGTSVLIRTAEGTKLLEALIAGRGVLQADHRDESTGSAWSVVVKGPVELIGDGAEHDAAEALAPPTWAGGWRHRFLRLDGEEVSGRRLQRALPPER